MGFSLNIWIWFGLDKCAVLVLKQWLQVCWERIVLLDAYGQVTGQIDEKWYKYFGVLKDRDNMQKEVKEKVKQ